MCNANYYWNQVDCAERRVEDAKSRLSAARQRVRDCRDATREAKSDFKAAIKRRDYAISERKRAQGMERESKALLDDAIAETRRAENEAEKAGEFLCDVERRGETSKDEMRRLKERMLVKNENICAAMRRLRRMIKDYLDVR